jgi:hypothetical protein
VGKKSISEKELGAPVYPGSTVEVTGNYQGAGGNQAEQMQHTVENIQDILQNDYIVAVRSYLPVDGEQHAITGHEAVAALSFEFTTIQRAVALECIERCGALGFDRFNAALGESQTMVHGDWRGREDIARWLSELPHSANSGDVYAVRA